MKETEIVEEIELSKTALKKQAKEVQNVVKELSKLSMKQVAKLDYPEEIKEELRVLHKMKTHPARARHIKYIAKHLYQSKE